MGKYEREKGKRGERQVCSILTQNGFPARRGQQFKGTPESPDIECTSLKKLHFECKWVEALSIYPALDQAIEDSGEDQVPVLCHKKSGQRWLATLDFEDFLDIVRDSGIPEPGTVVEPIGEADS